MDDTVVAQTHGQLRNETKLIGVKIKNIAKNICLPTVRSKLWLMVNTRRKPSNDLADNLNEEIGCNIVLNVIPKILYGEASLNC